MFFVVYRVGKNKIMYVQELEHMFTYERDFNIAIDHCEKGLDVVLFLYYVKLESVLDNEKCLSLVHKEMEALSKQEHIVFEEY